MGFRIATISDFPPNDNPFEHDAYNMGTRLGNNCMVMYGNHPEESCPYLILVNTATGERLRIDFEPDFYGKLALEIRRHIAYGEPLNPDQELSISMSDGNLYGWIDKIKED